MAGHNAYEERIRNFLEAYKETNPGERVIAGILRNGEKVELERQDLELLLSVAARNPSDLARTADKIIQRYRDTNARQKASIDRLVGRHKRVLDVLASFKTPQHVVREIKEIME